MKIKIPGIRYCKKCGVHKNNNQFKNKRPICHSCRNYESLMYDMYPESEKFVDKHYNMTKWKRTVLHKAKRRAKKLGVPFDLELKDIIIPERCPVLGTKLFKSKDMPRSNSPSIDRINSKRGYVRDNIVIVSYRVNSIKNNATINELRKIADFYEKLNVDDHEVEIPPIDRSFRETMFVDFGYDGEKAYVKDTNLNSEGISAFIFDFFMHCFSKNVKILGIDDLNDFKFRMRLENNEFLHIKDIKSNIDDIAKIKKILSRASENWVFKSTVLK